MLKRTNTNNIIRPKIAPHDACEFGFHMQACRQEWVQVNLDAQPSIRAAIVKNEIPSRLVKPFDNGVVSVDTCLMCHVAHGFTPKQYMAREKELRQGKTWN